MICSPGLDESLREKAVLMGVSVFFFFAGPSGPPSWAERGGEPEVEDGMGGE